MKALISAIIELVGDAVAGKKTEEEVAKTLIDTAFASGVPSSILAQHLTAKAAANAELAADLYQWAKTHGR